MDPSLLRKFTCIHQTPHSRMDSISLNHRSHIWQNMVISSERQYSLLPAIGISVTRQAKEVY